LLPCFDKIWIIVGDAVTLSVSTIIRVKFIFRTEQNWRNLNSPSRTTVRYKHHKYIHQTKVKLSLYLNWEPRYESVVGSGVIAPRIPAALPPGKEPLIPIGHEAEWAPQPVWTRWWREKFQAPARTRTPDHPARSPALYHWAIPSPVLIRYAVRITLDECNKNYDILGFPQSFRENTGAV
jgi:hypothetical protein